jgi:hypothetical protein
VCQASIVTEQSIKAIVNFFGIERSRLVLMLILVLVLVLELEMMSKSGRVVHGNHNSNRDRSF